MLPSSPLLSTTSRRIVDKQGSESRDHIQRRLDTLAVCFAFFCGNRRDAPRHSCIKRILCSRSKVLLPLAAAKLDGRPYITSGILQLEAHKKSRTTLSESIMDRSVDRAENKPTCPDAGV
uniref:Uncharacterized protein n=1 Tax=Steinernema glaseri TaxID=37863 RepID=A0A1I7YJG4_9BILA